MSMQSGFRRPDSVPRWPAVKPAVRRRLLSVGAAAVASGLIAGPFGWTLQAQAQQLAVPEAEATSTAPFEPQVGQAGKDVIWVPTPDGLVTRMLQLAGLTADDYLIDLGSGDGKIVIAAARDFGATGHGIEYNPDMVALAQRRAQEAGVADRARFEKADIFETDLSRASVISMYLLPQLNMKMRPALLKLKPGTRIVTNSFTMGNWPADETSRVGGSSGYLWIVPANAAGEWSLQLPQDAAPAAVKMKIGPQKFQFFEGSVELEGANTSLREARVIGEWIHFAFTDTRGRLLRFDGRVQDGKMEGQVSDGERRVPFSAERQGIAPEMDIRE